MGIEKKITEMLVTASCGDQKQIAETIAKEMGLVLDGRPITISFKMSIFDEVVDVETAHATIECLVDWINHRLESKSWKHEYCEPDIPMTTETKELIAKVSDSLHDVVSTLGK